MDEEITPLEFAKYRLERAKEDLGAAQLLYNNNSLLAANNRAYYAIFRAIRAVLALERVDFKRHKDVIRCCPSIISCSPSSFSKVKDDFLPKGGFVST